MTGASICIFLLSFSICCLLDFFCRRCRLSFFGNFWDLLQLGGRRLFFILQGRRAPLRLPIGIKRMPSKLLKD